MHRCRHKNMYTYMYVCKYLSMHTWDRSAGVNARTLSPPCESFVCVTWAIHMCDKTFWCAMTHSTRDMTPSPPFKSFVCVTRPIHTCDMPLWCVCDNSFYAWHPPLRVLCLRDMPPCTCDKTFWCAMTYSMRDTTPSPPCKFFVYVTHS